MAIYIAARQRSKPTEDCFRGATPNELNKMTSSPTNIAEMRAILSVPLPAPLTLVENDFIESQYLHEAARKEKQSRTRLGRYKYCTRSCQVGSCIHEPTSSHRWHLTCNKTRYCHNSPPESPNQAVLHRLDNRSVPSKQDPLAILPSFFLGTKDLEGDDETVMLQATHDDALGVRCTAYEASRSQTQQHVTARHTSLCLRS